MMFRKNEIVGYISLLLGSLILISILLIFLNVIPPAGSPITSFAMIIGFYYAFYKTIIKKEKLSKSEWIALIILLFIFFLPFFLFL